MIKTNKNPIPKHLYIDHEVVVSDPLYLFDKENSITINNMKPGKYICSYFAEKREYTCWSIEIHHVDANHDTDSSNWSLYNKVLVDTAQAGFFNFQNNTQEDVKKFLDARRKNQLACINDKIGFYTPTGYGDGEYPVYAIFDNDEIIALKINFY